MRAFLAVLFLPRIHIGKNARANEKEDSVWERSTDSPGVEKADKHQFAPKSVRVIERASREPNRRGAPITYVRQSRSVLSGIAFWVGTC